MNTLKSCFSPCKISCRATALELPRGLKCFSLTYPSTYCESRIHSHVTGDSGGVGCLGESDKLDSSLVTFYEGDQICGEEDQSSHLSKTQPQIFHDEDDERKKEFFHEKSQTSISNESSSVLMLHQPKRLKPVQSACAPRKIKGDVNFCMFKFSR